VDRSTGDPVALGARTWPGRTVSVDGTELFVREVPDVAPDAPPLVFVHGLGGSSLNFTAIGLLLADAGRGVAPDLPGFGRTPPRTSPGGITEHATLVESFLDQEYDEPVHLFGNSMGGAIAVHLAARRPDLVRTLTLVSPALPDPRPRAVSAWFAAMAMPRLGPAVLRRSARLPFERRVEVGMAMIFGNRRALPPEIVEVYEAELRRRDTDPWVAEAVLAGAKSIVTSNLQLPGRSLWADAARVRCPVLLVYGGRDRLVDARVRNRAQGAFRDARLLYLPESGHVAQIEHPQEVARGFRQLVRNA
jgi:pimeloyl-ACP methyl ester carboxylesterase